MKRTYDLYDYKKKKIIISKLSLKKAQKYLYDNRIIGNISIRIHTEE